LGTNRIVSQNINDEEQYVSEYQNHDFSNEFSALDGNILECLLEKSKKSN
jgi:hypothetical protein